MCGIAGNELPRAGHEGSGTKLLAQPRTRHQPPKRCTHGVPKEPRMPSAALASYARPQRAGSRAPPLTPAFSSSLWEGREQATLFLHPHGELRNTSTKGWLGEEPTRHYPNRGSFPGGVQLGAGEVDAGSWASPKRSSPPALGTAGHLSRTHATVNAVLCAHMAHARGDGKSHTFFY